MAVYNRIFDAETWKLVNKENKNIMNDFLLEYKARKMKPSTLEQYENDCRILLIYIYNNCDNRTITELKKRDFRNLTLWLSEDKGMSSARVNRIMSVCRSMLTYVEEDDEYDYDNNIAAKVKGLPKDPVRDIVFLSNDTIMTLYNYFMDKGKYKEATLLALAYESSARKNELAQVLKDSITDQRNCTNIVIGKRGKKFSLIYFDLTKRAAKKYLEARGEDNVPELFITADGRAASAENLYDWVVSWRKIVMELTGEELEFNVHSFRHSALENYSQGTHQHLINSNMESIPIEKLRLIAHHESIETTSNYLMPKDNKELEDLFGIKIESV